MRRLSAINAITPAWNHTRDLLLRTRRFGLIFKICLVAFFAQLGGLNFNANFPNSRHGHSPHLNSHLAGILITFAVVIIIAAIVISLVLFYLGSRLEFVLFEIVLRRDTTVGPIWRRYGRATWYWIGLKVLFFLAALLCLSPILVPLILHYIHSIPAGAEVVPHDFIGFFGAILGFIAAAFLMLVVIGIGYVLLRDFGLPSMALEGTSLGETVRRVLRLVRAEPAQVLFFVLMRFLLAFAGAIAAEFAIVIGTLVALIPLGGAGVVLWMALRHAGTVGHVFMIGGLVGLALILLVLVFIAAVLILGYLHCFLQAYALYFLGGRYPLLGSYLEPEPLQLVFGDPVPAAIYPPPPPVDLTE